VAFRTQRGTDGRTRPTDFESAQTTARSRDAATSASAGFSAARQIARRPTGSKHPNSVSYLSETGCASRGSSEKHDCARGEAASRWGDTFCPTCDSSRQAIRAASFFVEGDSGFGNSTSFGNSTNSETARTSSEAHDGCGFRLNSSHTNFGRSTTGNPESTNGENATHHGFYYSQSPTTRADEQCQAEPKPGVDFGHASSAASRCNSNINKRSSDTSQQTCRYEINALSACRRRQYA
jgi:hypothetical protein